MKLLKKYLNFFLHVIEKVCASHMLNAKGHSNLIDCLRPSLKKEKKKNCPLTVYVI
jgi:hypothetical protein